MVLRLVIQELRNRKVLAPRIRAVAGVINLDRVNPIAVRVRKRIQNHVVDHRKDGRSGTNPERERKHGRKKKRSILMNGPQTKAQILKEPAHSEARATSRPAQLSESLQNRTAHHVRFRNPMYGMEHRKAQTRNQKRETVFIFQVPKVESDSPPDRASSQIARSDKFSDPLQP